MEFVVETNRYWALDMEMSGDVLTPQKDRDELDPEDRKKLDFVRQYVPGSTDIYCSRMRASGWGASYEEGQRVTLDELDEKVREVYAERITREEDFAHRVSEILVIAGPVYYEKSRACERWCYRVISGGTAYTVTRSDMDYSFGEDPYDSQRVSSEHFEPEIDTETKRVINEAIFRESGPAKAPREQRGERLYLDGKVRCVADGVYMVEGSDGGEYRVTLKPPGCPCPDAGKGHHCKHCYAAMCLERALKAEGSIA